MRGGPFRWGRNLLNFPEFAPPTVPGINRHEQTRGGFVGGYPTASGSKLILEERPEFRANRAPPAQSCLLDFILALGCPTGLLPKLGERFSDRLLRQSGLLQGH